MDLYRQQILDHYKHPRNFGHLDNPDIKAEEGNVTCGDRIVMEVTLVKGKKQPETIEDIRFTGEGCAISQATASMLTEKTKGMKCAAIWQFDLSDVTKMLETTLTPSRVKCALLPLEVLQKAIATLTNKDLDQKKLFIVK